MACSSCPKPTMESCPPYANYHSVNQIKESICTNCVATVPANTPTNLFKIVGFNDEFDDCCNIFYVFEGTNLWTSFNKVTWSLSGAPSLNFTERTSFFSEEKADSLSNVFSMTSIPTGYDEIEIRGLLRAVLVNKFYIFIRVNNDLVLGNYDGGGSWVDESGANGGIVFDTHLGWITDATVTTSGIRTDVKINIQKHEDSGYYKNIITKTNGHVAAPGVFSVSTQVVWKSTADITRLDVYCGSSLSFSDGLFEVDSYLEGFVIKD